MANRFCVVVLQLFALSFACCADDVVRTDEREDDELVYTHGEKALHAAISHGDLAELKRLFKVLDRTTISNFRCEPWECSNVDVILFLRDQGKFPISDFGIAVLRGDADKVRELLPRFRDLNPLPDAFIGKTADGRCSVLTLHENTPLRLAIRRGHTEVVRVLIAGGVCVNERLGSIEPGRPDNEFPLLEAIRLGNAEIVQLLVDGGASMDDSAVQYCQKPGGVNLSEFYVTHKKSPHEVIQKKLKEMFDAGQISQEPDATANIGCPLMIAIQFGRAKIVSILLQAGANPNVLIGGGPLPPGANTNVFRLADHRPLHVAALRGNPEIVRLLIKNGADVNAVTSNGHRPLFCAVVYNHGDVADILRAAGAK